MRAFVQGRIGIPLPAWQRAFLVVAYRYLEERPLTAAEQRSLAALWDVDGIRERQSGDASIKRWLRERANYRPGTSPEISVYRQGGSPYSEYVNCLPPAFENATQTLRQRAKKFGAKSAELQQWIEAQDSVFRKCSDGSALPEPLPPSADSLLRADRAYQRAAALFYSGKLPEAIVDFDAIAQDRSSPWRTLAPYLAVRATIRQSWLATEAGTENEYDRTILARAEKRLAVILSGRQFAALHQDAEKLRSLVRFHLYPEQHQHELARILTGGRAGSNFGQMLIDYKLLLDRFLDVNLELEPEFTGLEPWQPEYKRRESEWRRKRYLDLTRERSDELTDWLVTLQSGSDAARMHALKRWKDTKSVAWLFAVMSKIKGNDSATAEILAATANISETSAAYTAIAFHRSRLLRESGDVDAARQVADDAIRHPDVLPISTLNLLRDEQMRNSLDFDRFGSLLIRQPLETLPGPDLGDSICYGEPACKVAFYGTAKINAGSRLLPGFDLSVAEALNKRVPVELLARAALSASLPENMRRELAPAAWARAALLGNGPAAHMAAGAAVESRPELKSFVDEYAAAQTEEERHFAAVFALLHFPGLRPFVVSAYPRVTSFGKIDNYRDNWWCTDVGGIPEEINFGKQENNAQIVEEAEKRLEAEPPAFLSEAQRTQAGVEWRQLLSMGIAARYLPGEVLAWAKKYPDDPRLPEALHYAWRTNRYGCDQYEENEAPDHLAHDLFKLLHRRYPNSIWTEKTPVW